MNDANMTDRGVVFVIDDDPDVCSALAWLIGSIKLETRTFPGISEFLDVCHPGQDGDVGCLVLDVRMPGMGGMEFLEHMNAMHIDLPVIMLSGHGTVAMATRALRLGAVDFVQKPIDEQVLLERIREALARSRQAGVRRALCTRLEKLSTREREVARLLVAGRHNKEIALSLGLSARTVEGHRAHVLQKLEIASAAELAVMLESSDLFGLSLPCGANQFSPPRSSTQPSA